MLGYAARAVPWTRVALAAALVVVLIELVRRDPWVLWPLEGTAVAVLVGAAAWCFDEQAAAVVDVAPRGLAWRTTARLPAVVSLAAVWVAVVLHARSVLFEHELAILLQGLVAIVAGTAWATWRRSGGEAMPGLLAATFAVPVATGWALVRPFQHGLPVFPYALGGEYGDWQTSTIGWTTAGAFALIALGITLADARWWRGSHRPFDVSQRGSTTGTTAGPTAPTRTC
ncbi:MAG: hypothetical protein QM714_17585 [Nocardioides sp.]|uniref:hypothetical protein n=1 Tax=Nocardioides sp. TaxID=35761 RepID=UPI0039E632B2